MRALGDVLDPSNNLVSGLVPDEGNRFLIVDVKELLDGRLQFPDAVVAVALDLALRQRGGAVYLTNTGTAVVERVRLAGNRSVLGGEASWHAFTVVNSIIYGHHVLGGTDYSASIAPELSHSIMDDAALGVGTNTTGNPAFTAAPQFDDLTTGTGTPTTLVVANGAVHTVGNTLVIGGTETRVMWPALLGMLLLSNAAVAQTWDVYPVPIATAMNNHRQIVERIPNHAAILFWSWAGPPLARLSPPVSRETLMHKTLGRSMMFPERALRRRRVRCSHPPLRVVEQPRPDAAAPLVVTRARPGWACLHSWAWPRCAAAAGAEKLK